MSDGENDEENANKVIFIGDSGVGKNNLIRVSTGQKFEPAKLSTTHVSSITKKVLYNKKTHIFNLWDTIGQEKYKSITRLFYRNSKIVLYIYDITNKGSFIALEKWIEDVEKEIGKDYVMAIVGNKKDLFLQEEVAEEEAKQYAETKNCKFKLASAKEESLLFIEFLNSLFIDYLNQIEGNDIKERETLSIKSDNKENQKKCC